MVEYRHIRIDSSEKARYEGKPLSQAVIQFLREEKIGARCSVVRGHEALYESGELATSSLVDLSYNLPVLIDVFVPAAEADRVASHLRSMVHDGLIGVDPVPFQWARSGRHLLPAGLLVKDLMSAPPLAVHLEFPLRAVVELMLDHRRKAVPVVDDANRVVGILSTRDLLRTGMPVRLGLFPELSASEKAAFFDKAASLTAAQVMTRHPVVVRDHDPAVRAVHQLVAHGHKRLPVVDAGKTLVGVIARFDLLRAISVERAERTVSPMGGTTLRQMARLDAVPVPRDADLLTAVDILTRQGEERAAVVDPQGRVVGTIGDRELFRALGNARIAGASIRRSRRARTKVAQVMVPTVTVELDAPVDEALRLMVEQGVKRLPVVEDGRFAGIVCRDALLASLSRQE